MTSISDGGALGNDPFEADDYGLFLRVVPVRVAEEDIALDGLWFLQQLMA